MAARYCVAAREREHEHTNTWTNKWTCVTRREAFVNLWLYYLGLSNWPISLLILLGFVLGPPPNKSISFSLLLSLLFKYSCLHPPLLSPIPPTPTSHPWSYPRLAWSMGPLYMFLDNPCPSFPNIPFPSPLVTVSLFFISMSLVVFCLLVCFVD